MCSETIYYNKRLRVFHKHSNDARLKYLDLQSLELRRLIVDLIWCYKIVFGLVDIDVNVPHIRGHVYKLYKAYSSGIRSSFFCERVINVWNSLPADIDFSTGNTFKRGIDCVDFTHFLRRCLRLNVCVF